MRQQAVRQDRKAMVIKAVEDERREDRGCTHGPVKPHHGFALSGDRLA
jgi:hypothetical protein